MLIYESASTNLSVDDVKQYMSDRNPDLERYKKSALQHVVAVGSVNDLPKTNSGKYKRLQFAEMFAGLMDGRGKGSVRVLVLAHAVIFIVC